MNHFVRFILIFFLLAPDLIFGRESRCGSALSLAPPSNKLKLFTKGRRDYRQFYSDWEQRRSPGVVDLSTVHDRFPDLTPRQVTEIAHRFRDQNTNSVDIIPQQAKEIVFDIPIEGLQAHTIVVIMRPREMAYRGLDDVAYASMLVGYLPFKTFRATTMVEVSPLDPEARETELTLVQGQADSSGNLYLQSYSRKGLRLEKLTFLHEHGHNVGGHIFRGLMVSDRYEPDFWGEVIEADQYRYVSEYAQFSLTEDFAETFSHYLLLQGGKKNSAQSAQDFSSRYHALDLLFAENHGGLVPGGYWTSVQSYLQTREKLREAVILCGGGLLVGFGTVAILAYCR